MAIFLCVGTGLLLLGASALVWFGSEWFITPRRNPLEARHLELLKAPAESGMELEHHPVTAPDGVVLKTILATRSPNPGEAARTRRMLTRLESRGIPTVSEGRGTVYLLHGRGGIKENMLWVAQRFVAADFRCVVYDARAHGSSGGRYCTFGDCEVADLRAVIDHYEALALERGESHGRSFVFGNSLGAAVALQALPCEDRIAAAVAVATYAELPEVVLASGRNAIHPRLPAWLIRAAMFTGGRRAGFDPFTLSPIKAVAGTQTPLLLAHGGQDGLIPVEHARRLHSASASPTKTLREIPGAYHYNILAEGGDDLYEEMILFFLAHSESSMASEQAPHVRTVSSR